MMNGFTLILLFFHFYLFDSKSTRSNKAPLGKVRVNNIQKSKLHKLVGPQTSQDDIRLIEQLKENTKRKAISREQHLKLRREKKTTTLTPTSVVEVDEEHDDDDMESEKLTDNLIVPRKRRSLLDKMKAIKVDVNIVNENVLISDKQKLMFNLNGHIRLNDMFNAKEIENTLQPKAIRTYESNKLTALRHKVRVSFGKEDFVGNPINPDILNQKECEDLLAKVDQDAIPFMQLFNLWKKDKDFASIALSPVLGKVAAELLGSPTSDCTTTYRIHLIS